MVHDAVEAADELGSLAKNIEFLLLEVEKENHVHLRRGKKLTHELNKLIEKIYMECPVSEADHNRKLMLSTRIIKLWVQAAPNLHLCSMTER